MLTKDEFNALPEKAQAGFAEVDGEYLPVKDAKLKATLDDLDKKNKELSGKLSQFEQDKQAAIEQAANEAREKALEEARKNNDWEAQEKLLREKFEDELKRNAEETRSTVEREYTVKQAQAALDSDVKLLASELALRDSAKAALEVIIAHRAKLDENGNRNYFGEDGSALSITDLKAFKDELQGDPSLSLLVKGKTPSSGGLADGGSGGRAPVKKPSKMTTAERLAFKERDPDGFKKAFNL